MQIAAPIPDNDARQAVNALAGYAYQLYQTLSAWLRLEPDQLLCVEVAEDYAVATSQRIAAAQIRATAANITLNSQYVAEALNAYWTLRQKNASRRVTYRYVTTSSVGKERGLAFPNDSPGLVHWRDAARPGSDLTAIRSALLTLSLSGDLRSFVAAASDEELRDSLISSVHWDCGEANLEVVREQVALQTASRAKSVADATVTEGRLLVGALIAHLLDKSSSKGTRQVASIELDEIIERHLLVSVPRRQFAALLRSRGDGVLDIDQVAVVAPNAIPLPEPLLEREDLTTALSRELTKCGSLYLQASSGKGKSTISRLITAKVGSAWIHVDFYKFDLDQTKSRLIKCASDAALNKASYLLDDLAVEYDTGIESALAVLSASLRANDRLLLVTTRVKPSSRIRDASGRPTASLYEMPNLSIDEVSYLISSLGGEPAVWANVTYTVCGQGHPQLVMARLKRLAAAQWPNSEILVGLSPQTPAAELQDEKAATHRRLLFEVDESSRTFINRLSAVAGRFDRPLALALAATPPPIPDCGYVLTQLTGPWIEQLEGGQLGCPLF